MQPIAYILHPFLIQYLRVLSTKYKTECSYPYIGKNFQFETLLNVSDLSKLDKNILTWNFE